MNTQQTSQKLIFEGIPEAIAYLEELKQSGELDKILGVPIVNAQATINLGEILQQIQDNITIVATNLKEVGCNLIENVFEPPYIDSQLAYAYGAISENPLFQFKAPSQQPSIEDLITRLDNSEKDDDRHLLAKRLAEICSPKSDTEDSEEQKNLGKQKAIATLINLIENTKKREIRWQAIEYLSLISPEDIPPNIIAFWENIGVRVTDIPLKLFVGIAIIFNGKLNVFLRLYPQNITDNLPQGIKLIILDENGTVFKEISDDQKIKALMYKFTLSSGDKFNIRIALNDNSFTTRTYIG